MSVDLNEAEENKKLNLTGDVPTGTVLFTAAQSLPKGFLWCNGKPLSRKTFSKLYDAIGLTYGDGNGNDDTFSLPDLRGRYVLTAGNIKPQGDFNFGDNFGSGYVDEVADQNVAFRPLQNNGVPTITASKNDHKHTVLPPSLALGSMIKYD